MLPSVTEWRGQQQDRAELIDNGPVADSETSSTVREEPD